jgi:hypothetical protein
MLRLITKKTMLLLLAVMLPASMLVPTISVSAAPPPLENDGYLLAAGDRTSVISQTSGNSTTNNNGTEWYLSPNISMGFAPGGASVELNSADTTEDPSTDALRLSWHMNGTEIRDGWRIGEETGVGSEGMRFIYQANSTPSYYPSGPQSGVDPTTVTNGGWSLCYSGSYVDSVDTTDLFANTCTGDYLMYAATLAPANYFDITVDGASVLQELGDSWAEWPVFSGDTLEMKLYDNDETTLVPWNHFVVYKSVDCNPQDCEPYDSPIDSPSSWDSGFVVNNGEYVVDQEDSFIWLWVYQADDSTGEPVPGTDSIRVKVLPAPVDLTIDECEELQAIDDFESSEYATVTLEGDVDCAGQEFEPLFQNESFQGTIDGNGYTIKNVTINQPEDSSVGLIEHSTRMATISDLNLDNFEIIGSYEVAGLLASADGGLQVENVHGTNIHVYSSYEGYAGGLFGDIDVEDGYDSTIENVSVEGSVTGTGEYSVNIGGLAGMIEAQSTDLVINQVYADVQVSNSTEENTDEQFSDVGGLFGELEADNDYDGGDSATITLTNAYSWGNTAATNSENVGGLVGRVDVELYGGSSITALITIENVYAKGSVSGGGDVGGLFGQFDEVGDAEEPVYVVNNSFAMGAVSELDELPETSVGGLVGFFEENAADVSTFSGNYFDQTRTGQDSCNELVEVTGCSPVNSDGSQADYFINNATSAPLNAWDFEGVWIVNEDVPPTFAPYVLGEDLNGDFISDENQSQISGYTSPITGKTVAIDVGDSCEITTDDIVQESNLDAQDAQYDYQNGLFDFAADCGEEGFTTTVRFFYYDIDSEGLVLRKHNPNTNTFFDINGATLTETTIHGRPVTVATFIITDGGELDMDGEINGEFSDPAGVATSAQQTDDDLATTGVSSLLILVLSTTLVAAIVLVSKTQAPKNKRAA